jgi:uracil-DNA glycosylase family 4
MDGPAHWCRDPLSFPLERFFQAGAGRGARLLLVGLAPAAQGWRLSGRAFTTPEGRLLPSGRRLNSLLQPLGLTLDACAFTDLVKCFPGARPRPAQLAACARGCWPIFERQLQQGEFRLIVVLGKSTAVLLGRLLGTAFPVGELGLLPLHGRNYPLLPLYHPSPAHPFSQAWNAAILARLAPRLAGLLGD